MSEVKFKKGLKANFPETKEGGTLYVSTDSNDNQLYIDLDDSTRVSLSHDKEDNSTIVRDADGKLKTSIGGSVVVDPHEVTFISGEKTLTMDTIEGRKISYADIDASASGTIFSVGDEVTLTLFTDDAKGLNPHTYNITANAEQLSIGLEVEPIGIDITSQLSQSYGYIFVSKDKVCFVCEAMPEVAKVTDLKQTVTSPTYNPIEVHCIPYDPDTLEIDGNNKIKVKNVTPGVDNETIVINGDGKVALNADNDTIYFDSGENKVKATSKWYSYGYEAETYLINDNPDVSGDVSQLGSEFTSNGNIYNGFIAASNNLIYSTDGTETIVYDGTSWVDDNYKTVLFNGCPSYAVSNWLAENATKQKSVDTTVTAGDNVKFKYGQYHDLKNIDNGSVGIIKDYNGEDAGFVDLDGTRTYLQVKELGKGLSSNDFTDSDKNKLATVSEGANNVKVSETGETTEEISYITITNVDGHKVEKKIAGGAPKWVEREVPLPVWGDVINIQDAPEGAKNYKVLLVDGTVVEVLGMDEINTSIAFDTDGSNIYEGKAVDTYLNDTWYNTLSQKMKDAIVAKTFKQDSWGTDSLGDPSYKGRYGTVIPPTNNYDISLGNEEFGNEITRNVYALSTKDVVDFLGVSPESSYEESMLQNTNIWEMYHNSPEVPSTTYRYWLRSAHKAYTESAFYVDGGYGIVGNNNTNDPQAVRASFQIDLSKIEWEKHSSNKANGVDIEVKFQYGPEEQLSQEDGTISVSTDTNKVSVDMNGNRITLQTAEDGKGLSTNDFTDEYKTKIDSMEISSLKIGQGLFDPIASGTALTDCTAQSWDPEGRYLHKYDITVSGVTDNTEISNAVFALNSAFDALAPVIETGLDTVTVYSTESTFSSSLTLLRCDITEKAVV